MSGTGSPKAEPRAPKKPIAVGLPEKINLTEGPQRIEVARKWFRGEIVIITIFVVIWDGFLLVWYGKAFAQPSTLAFLFPLLHLQAGIFLTYYVLAYWMNRTVVTIDRESVRIRHRPIPWLGKRDYATADIRRLYVKDVMGAFRYGRLVWELRAVLRNNYNVTLVSGLDDQEQALFMQQAIERFLRQERPETSEAPEEATMRSLAPQNSDPGARPSQPAAASQMEAVASTRPEPVSTPVSRAANERPSPRDAPAKMRIADKGTDIDVTRVWWRWEVIPYTFFALLWDGIWVNYFVEMPARPPWIAFVVPLLPIGAGAWLSYFVLAVWINRTRIRVGKSGISVRHLPLPWPGAKDLDAADVKQVYAKPVRHWFSVYRRTFYELRVITGNGRNIRLTGGIETAEQALSTERTIEAALGIEDRPVPGEIDKHEV